MAINYDVAYPALLKKYNDLKREARRLVCDYTRFEGCSCCRDIENHERVQDELGRLLDIPRFDDDSGVDFNKYRSKEYKFDRPD